MQKYAEMRGFGHKKQTVHKELSVYGRGIRIRTLNNGVRVRCVTVTLYLYIIGLHNQCVYYYNL